MPDFSELGGRNVDGVRDLDPCEGVRASFGLSFYSFRLNSLSGGGVDPMCAGKVRQLLTPPRFTDLASRLIISQERCTSVFVATTFPTMVAETQTRCAGPSSTSGTHGVIRSCIRSPDSLVASAGSPMGADTACQVRVNILSKLCSTHIVSDA
eukprot:9472700-Pyramimonas_sp.AAC.6